jgi:hypothetical protein
MNRKVNRSQLDVVSEASEQIKKSIESEDDASSKVSGPSGTLA